jgi:hypothetical protein
MHEMSKTNSSRKKSGPQGMVIDSVHGGRLVGRSQVAASSGAETFWVEIDSVRVAQTQATRFCALPRALDLSEEDGARWDYYGFDVPIDAAWYDGAAHTVTLRALSDKLLCRERCVFPLNQNARFLKGSLLFERELLPHKGQQCVAVVAGFASQGGLSLHQKRQLQDLCGRGYYVIHALALADDALGHHPWPADGMCHLQMIRRNVGYDFGSWAHAWLVHRPLLAQCKEVLFVNDSMVGPLFPSRFHEEFNALEHDLCGVTESYQRAWHVQSYCWRVGPRLLATAHLDHFFCGRHPPAATKDDAIGNYELALGSYFRNEGFSVGVWASTGKLKALAFDAFQRTLQHRLAVNGLTYQQTDVAAAVNRLFAEKALPFLATLLSDANQNPSQHYWKGLIEQGFPFVKKELLTKNLVQYPFVDELAALFDSTELSAVLVDLLRRADASVAHSV